MSQASPISGVDFAVVFVTDYPRAVEFYGQTLGLEHSVDYGKIPGGEFEAGNLTLQVVDAAAIGREFEPQQPPDRLPRRRRRSHPLRPRSQGSRLPRRHSRQQRLPHGPFSDPDGNTLMLHRRYAPRE